MSVTHDEIIKRMNLRLEVMLARSRQAHQQRSRLKKLEHQIRYLAEKLEVDLV